MASATTCWRSWRSSVNVLHTTSSRTRQTPRRCISKSRSRAQPRCSPDSWSSMTNCAKRTANLISWLNWTLTRNCYKPFCNFLVSAFMARTFSFFFLLKKISNRRELIWSQVVIRENIAFDGYQTNIWSCILETWRRKTLEDDVARIRLRLSLVTNDWHSGWRKCFFSFAKKLYKILIKTKNCHCQHFQHP